MHQIVRIYAGFHHGESGEDEVSRIFDTADFGYRAIRVERPPKLNFQVNTERLSRLADQKRDARQDETNQMSVEAALSTIGDILFNNRDVFEDALNKASNTTRLKIGAPEKKGDPGCAVRAK